MSTLSVWISGCLLLSLRIGPVFALAPPFTLVKFPMLFRVLFATGLAATIVSFHATALDGVSAGPGFLVVASVRELMVSLTFVLALQLTFGAIYLAGRTIDVQAGFGLALLIDPTSGSRTPFVGTIFALVAGLLFFAMNGHHDLLRIIAASLDAIPLGSPHFLESLGPLLAFISAIFVVGMGVAGGVILCLFLTDLAIAMLSRTIPQMNVLVLGFQAKTLVLLIALPMTLGFAAALMARMLRMTLEAMPGLL